MVVYSDGDLVFRTPEPADGPAAWSLVESDKQLDTNSPYYYTLWFRDFAQESLVAALGGEVIGFVNGYRRPNQPDTYFVWQEVVKPRHGIRDLGVNLFQHAANWQIDRGVNFIEATVSVNNKPIIMVLKRFAKLHSAKVETSVLFPSDYFPDAHHEEVLYRIGPLSPRISE